MHLSGVWEICRQRSWGRGGGGAAGGRGSKGSVRMLEVGISSSSPAWTPEPQCGVPVHILKHHDCLVFAGFCLFLSSFPPSPPHTPSHLLLLLSALLPLFLALCLSRGSYITWLEFFLVIAAASRWVRLGWLSSNAILPPLSSVPSLQT